MFEPSTEELLTRNRDYVERFDKEAHDVIPDRHLAVVTCMDSRMDIFEILGLGNGEAHIIRNAGGVITDDVIRSLCLSQRFLQTQEILLLHHTDCGLQKVVEQDFYREMEAEIGIKPWWAVESFDDPYLDVRQSMQRIAHTPFIKHKDNVRGFVYDVANGQCNEVLANDP